MFAAAGATVVIATRSAENGQAVADAIIKQGGQAHLMVMDVTDDAAVASLIGFTVETYGAIDIMVHNAAAFGTAPVDGLTPRFTTP